MEYSLITRNMAPMVGDLIKLLITRKQEVEPNLLALHKEFEDATGAGLSMFNTADADESEEEKIESDRSVDNECLFLDLCSRQKYQHNIRFPPLVLCI